MKSSVKRFRQQGKPYECFVHYAAIGHPDECWEWRGCIEVGGYGCWYHSKQRSKAHQMAYKLFVGDPGELCVLHKCGNRKCCNPNHLYAGTPKENYDDMVEHGTVFLPPKGSVAKNQFGHSPLTEDDVREIRRRREAGERGIHKDYGVSPSTICLIHKRKQWAWVED